MKRATIVEIISALFILLFVYTALSKLFEGSTFIGSLKASPLIGSYATTIAWALPVTEILIGLLLVIPKTRTLGLWASTVLMTVFTIYIGYMIAFTPKLPCSCGGIMKHMTWNEHLIFNVFFTLLAILGVMLSRKSNNHELAAATAVGSKQNILFNEDLYCNKRAG